MTYVASLPSLWQSFSRRSAAPFLITRDSQHSHGDLMALARRYAARFHGLALPAESRVVICLSDELLAIGAFVAALFDGHVPVMLSPQSGRERVSGVCAAVDAALLVCGAGEFPGLATPRLTPDAAAAGAPARQSGGFLSRLLGSGGERRLAPGLATEGEDPRLPEGRDGLAYLLFTSGTTAAPTGVEITRHNLFFHIATLCRLFGFDAHARVFNATPLGHTDGLVMGPLLALVTGGALIRPGAFEVGGIEQWLDQLRLLRATHMISNPTVLALIDRFASQNDYFDAPEFRGIICSASLLSPAQWQRFETRFRTELWNLYGLTETVTTALYAGRHPEMGAIGSIGKAIDCEVRLGDAQGEALPAEPGASGEIQLRGGHIFRGYWRNPERSRATFTPDGFMRTGDIGRLRPDGSYDFLGRLKAAINSGGTLIRGEEIDECLLRHPAVAECVTIGLPDPDFEEIPVSAVVLKQEAGEDELTAHARSQLEPLKVPKRIVAVASIPRGDSGKPKLEALRGMLRDLVEAPRPASAPAADLEEEIRQIAARVFRVDAASLSAASTPDTVKGWDSFTQLNLILETEAALGLRIPASAVAKLRSLGQLAAAVKAVRG